MLGEFFNWARALHIIADIAWIAGMLIYPRLLIYRLEAQGDPRWEAAMDKAAKNTRNIILTPSIILAWLMGLAMLGDQWDFVSQHWWMWTKIVLVLALSGVHGYLIGLGKKIARGERPIEPKRLRMLNELPMLIAIVVVILIVVKP